MTQNITQAGVSELSPKIMVVLWSDEYLHLSVMP